MSADLLKHELARILLAKWDWEVRLNGPKEYIVPFPSPVELKKLVAIKRIPTNNNEGIIYFEEWSQVIKLKWKLHKMWVHVYGVPHGISSFLPLWAIGTTLGTTDRVDMNYLGKHGVVRLLVDILDAHKIPSDADIIVKGYMYTIYLKVDEIVSDTEHDFDEDDLLDEDDAQCEGEDHEMSEADHTNERQDTSTAERSNVGKKGGSVPMTPKGEIAFVESILDDVATRLIEEISYKVLNEETDAEISLPGNTTMKPNVVSGN